MSFIPKPHEIYKHFKGNLYQIVAIAEHSETGEQMVIYQALYGEFKIYARPLDMFSSRIDKEKYPDVKQEFRFALQGENRERQAEESRNADVPEHTAGASEAVEHGTAAASPQEQAGCTEDSQELTLDPMVLEFLDADDYETRLNILAGIHHRITDEMLTTMAIACDIELDEEDTEKRYESLRNCLLTLEKYECNRLR